MSTKQLKVKPKTDCCSPVGSIDFDISDAEQLANGFAALADPVRLKMFSVIVSSGRDGVCACDLIGPSGKSQPTVSHHLRVLRDAGLVSSERRGTWIWYQAIPSAVAALRSALK